MRWRRCSASKPPAEVPAAVGAALAVALAAGKTDLGDDGLCRPAERFTRWYVQLWAESLGKDGKGTTPIGALGPVDQHSQLQLYIAGPRDKLFTIVTAIAGRAAARASTPTSPSLRASRTSPARPSAISSRRRAAPPPRRWRRTAARCAPSISNASTSATLGELLMHFMLETIIAAHLLGVDPFDQPAVEEGKVLAKKYLAG